MKIQQRVFAFLIAGVIVLSACAPAITPEPVMEKTEDAMMEDAMTDEAMTEEAMTEEAAMEDHSEMTEEAMTEESSSDMMAEESMADAPAWYAVSLTDARTGETFSISELKGKVVLVETMAMWCSNCLRQQGEVKALHGLVGEREDFVGIGLDIDPNENAEALKSYVEKNGFDWLYAVSPAEVSQEISALYGPQFLNPPSTPIVIIDRKGEAHILPFGIKSAEDLFQAVEPFLNEGM